MKKYCSLCNSQDLKYIKYLKFKNYKSYLYNFIIFFIYKVLPIPLIEQLPLKVKSVLMRGIWLPNSKITYCNSCGYGVLKNIPNLKSIKFWYDNEGQTSNLSTKRLSRARSQFNFINQNIDLNKIKSLLDYGCGNYPGLVEMIFNQNDKININVSDISKLTTDILSKKSFIFRAYQATTPKEISEKFDFIILSHIVNNVKDDLRFIKEITSLLNKEGILLVEIKNCNLDYYKYCEKHFPFFNFFDDNSFQKMISKFDLEVIKLKYFGPTNYNFFKVGVEKTYEENDNGIFLRYLLKKK